VPQIGKCRVVVLRIEEIDPTQARNITMFTKLTYWTLFLVVTFLMWVVSAKVAEAHASASAGSTNGYTHAHTYCPNYECASTHNGGGNQTSTCTSNNTAGHPYCYAYAYAYAHPNVFKKSVVVKVIVSGSGGWAKPLPGSDTLSTEAEGYLLVPDLFRLSWRSDSSGVSQPQYAEVALIYVPGGDGALLDIDSTVNIPTVAALVAQLPGAQILFLKTGFGIDSSDVFVGGKHDSTLVLVAAGGVSSAQIPTLSEWGMIVFVVLLAGWMAFVVVRRWKKTGVTAA
jgi:hypothetical protein